MFIDFTSMATRGLNYGIRVSEIGAADKRDADIPAR